VLVGVVHVPQPPPQPARLLVRRKLPQLHVPQLGWHLRSAANTGIRKGLSCGLLNMDSGACRFSRLAAVGVRSSAAHARYVKSVPADMRAWSALRCASAYCCSVLLVNSVKTLLGAMVTVPLCRRTQQLPEDS
jgi:hypothetical protein